MMLAKFFVAGCAAVFVACVATEHAQAQFVNPVPPPPPPVFNPSSPYTVPQMRETPVSPNAPSAFPGSGALLQQPPTRAPCSVLNGRPCHPSSCGVFHRGPCFPDYGPPLGENWQLTIVSTDNNDPANKSGGDNDNAENNQTLDSVGQMFTALRACWVPPPKDQAHHGMEYTVRLAFKRGGEMIAPPRMTYSSQDAPDKVRDLYRDAVDAALKRCTPLHFTRDMAEAVVGQPIAIRFVDNRTIDNTKTQQ